MESPPQRCIYDIYLVTLPIQNLLGFLRSRTNKGEMAEVLLYVLANKHFEFIMLIFLI